MNNYVDCGRIWRQMKPYIIKQDENILFFMTEMYALIRTNTNKFYFSVVYGFDDLIVLVNLF